MWEKSGTNEIYFTSGEVVDLLIIASTCDPETFRHPSIKAMIHKAKVAVNRTMETPGGVQIGVMG